MELVMYIADPAKKRALAEATRRSEGYLWQVATGWRGKRASAELARAIESHTSGEVTRAEVRPDLFGEIDHKAVA